MVKPLQKRANKLYKRPENRRDNLIRTLDQVRTDNKQGLTKLDEFVFDPKSYLDDKQLQKCMDLFVTNMGAMYKASSWGLDLDEKRHELQHANARFVIVTCKGDDSGSNNNSNNEAQSREEATNKDDNNKVVNNKGNSSSSTLAGFIHYRIELDDDDRPTRVVLYLYEIQIDIAQQRKGLGRFLLLFVEDFARRVELDTVMMTVFKSNKDAIKFYENMGYSIDQSSPSRYNNDQKADYEVLSKVIA